MDEQLSRSTGLSLYDTGISTASFGQEGQGNTIHFLDVHSLLSGGVGLHLSFSICISQHDHFFRRCQVLLRPDSECDPSRLWSKPMWLRPFRLKDLFLILQ